MRFGKVEDGTEYEAFLTGWRRALTKCTSESFLAGIGPIPFAQNVTERGSNRRPSIFDSFSINNDGHFRTSSRCQLSDCQGFLPRYTSLIKTLPQRLSGRRSSPV